jgi:asparagine synthase (glutamine-hydrolysing)
VISGSFPGVDDDRRPSAGGRRAKIDFDGRLDNAAELRRMLAERGVRLPDDSEAALIAAVHEHCGAAGIEQLEGHFALAITTPSALLLVRDGFGTKPLHYHVADDRSHVLFGSTGWNIVSRLPHGVDIDAERLCDFLVFGRVLGNGTLLRGIKTVRPGHVVTATRYDGRIVLEEHEVPDPSEPPVTTYGAAVDGIAALIDAAVGRCLADDAPTGVALSGGLDSSTIALFAHARRGAPLLTFTLGSSAEGGDAEAAGRLAAQIGAAHCEIPLTFEAYVASIPAVIRAREFATVAGVTVLLLAQRAAQDCGVCLTGFGAGDVFGDVNQDLNWDLYCSRLRHKRRRAAALGMPSSDEAEMAFDAAFAAGSYSEYYDRAGYGDQGVDWIGRCGAAGSVELRAPFCSDALYRFVRSVSPDIRQGPPPGGDKHLLRCVALQRFGDLASVPVRRPKGSMPDVIVGFQRRFADMCHAAIDDRDVRRHRFGAWVGDKHLLLLLDVFARLFHDRCSPEDVCLRDLVGATSETAI